MKYNLQMHHRRSIRKKGYDYSSCGAYFVTMNTQKRESFFGCIIDNEMELNDSGLMIEKWYNELPQKFPGVILDEYIIMPDHFHCIIWIDSADRDEFSGQTHRSARTGEKDNIVPDAGIPRIIQWFKTMTTNEYICGVKKCRWMPFDKRLWQRNYYEHIIRNDEELNRIREYIKNNPREWHNKKSMYVEEPSEEYTYR